jgi:DGQHR domain-containing protein
MSKVHKLINVGGPYDLPVITFRQSGVEIFLTTVTAKMLREWRDHEILVLDRFKKEESGSNTGYQRVLDDRRSRRIAQFLCGEGPTRKAVDIILPLLPQTVLLNVRQGGRSPKPIEGNRLRVFSATRLAQVDGQHRIAGLIQAIELSEKTSGYTLPVAIVNGLTLSQEAAQFLTINSTQRKVKADLELRVIYHRDKNQCQRLATALGFEQWKIKALALTIELNDTVPSPWENAITRPGERARRGISEGSFVDSLEPVCTQTRALGRCETKDAYRFLNDYWAVVAENYKSAWSEDDRRAFAIRKTLGVSVFHQLAAFSYELCLAQGTDSTRPILHTLLGPVFRSYPEREWRRGGRFAQLAGKGPARSVANQISRTILGGLDPKSKDLKALEKRLQRAARRETDRFERVRNLLSPLNLRNFEADSIAASWSGEAGGAYVLAKISAGSPVEVLSVYIGKSEKHLGKRLRTHLKGKRHWDLFSAIQANSDQACTTLEGMLYHLVPKERLANKAHPPNCPLCDREWPPKRKK